MRRPWLLAAVLLLLAGTVLAEANFPVPQGFINDYAGVLTPQQKQQLVDISRSLQRRNGAQLAVAIVPTVAPLDPKTYAVKLFEKWGIGEKKKDNGVLILLALAERRIEIEVGYGLEGVLNDARCGRVLDVYAIPRFKRGEMGAGVIATSDALRKIISGDEPITDVLPQPESAAGDDEWPIVLTMLLSIGLPLIIIISAFMSRPWAILISLAGLLAGFFFFGWIAAICLGVLGLVIGFWTAAVKYEGGDYGSGGGSSSSSDSSSSSSFSSDSSSDGSSSFDGGSSGGGGAGRSW